MTDHEPSDSDISVMVDIARSAGTMLSGDKQTRLPALLEAGLIEAAASKDGEGDRYKLTPQGQAVLDERGVGANES
jgi:hypothetical protein